MAKAYIHESGLGVKLYLSFEEAAALFALLCRVGEATNPQINEATYQVFDELQNIKNEIEYTDEDLWDKKFDDFACSFSPLLDPDGGDEDSQQE